MEKEQLSYEKFNEIRLALLLLLNSRKFRNEKEGEKFQQENQWLDAMFWRYFHSMSETDKDRWVKETDMWVLFPCGC